MKQIYKFTLPIIVLAIIGAFLYIKNSHYLSSSKINYCKTLKPGTKLDDLIKVLGDPIQEKKTDGDSWFFFLSDPLAAGPIKARVDKNTKYILELRCSEDGSAKWSMSVVEIEAYKKGK